MGLIVETVAWKTTTNVVAEHPGKERSSADTGVTV
jgi:hypothetical protein